MTRLDSTDAFCAPLLLNGLAEATSSLFTIGDFACVAAALLFNLAFTEAVLCAKAKTLPLFSTCL